MFRRYDQHYSRLIVMNCFEDEGINRVFFAETP